MAGSSEGFLNNLSMQILRHPSWNYNMSFYPKI